MERARGDSGTSDLRYPGSLMTKVGTERAPNWTDGPYRGMIFFISQGE